MTLTQGETYSTEAQAFFARMATPGSSGFKAALDDYFVALDDGGVLPHLTALQVLGGETQADSLLNLVSTSFTLAAAGGAVGFTAGRGMASNGSSSLTGWGLASSFFASANDMFVAFFTTKTGNMLTAVGHVASSNNMLVARNGGVVSSRMFNSGGRNTNHPAGVGMVVVRRLSGNVYVEVNGVNILTTTDTPAAISQSLAVMQAVTTRSTDTYFMVAAGTYIDAAQSLAFYDATAALAVALGWQFPTNTSDVLAASSVVTLPDGASHGTAGKGFTCTGIVKDSADGSWWINNYGMATGADTRAASLVHLSSDFSTILGEITMASLGLAATIELQGLCEDTSDGTLYLASAGEGKIYQVSKAGALLATLSSIATAGSMSGLAYDSINDRLIVGTATTVQRFTMAGVAELPQFRLPFTIDQLSFHAANNWLLGTDGMNGSPGYLRIMELGGEYGSYPRLLHEVELTEFTAAEGCYLDGTTLYATSDDYFHNEPAPNTIQTYDLTGILDEGGEALRVVDGNGNPVVDSDGNPVVKEP